MNFTKKKAIYFLLAGFVCVAVTALVIANTKEDSHPNTWVRSDAALGHQPVYRDAIEEVSLTLNQNGFQPLEIRPEGRRFLLSVDNRTGLKKLVLRLTQGNGPPMREIRVVGDGGDWSELFDLDHGSYTFSEVAHPNWSCTIIVQ